jgi:four helix bundle protein
MFAALSKTELVRVLGKQALRSGTSVGANYRKAFGARSGPEFISKIGDCLKELDEPAYWLELLVESAVVPAARMTSV